MLRSVSITVFFGALILCAVAVGQESKEHTFVRITHTPYGVIAVDSTGAEWYYDDENGIFVLADDAPQRLKQRIVGGAPGSGSDSGAVLPPSIRCTDVVYRDLVEILSGDIIVEFDQRIEGNVTNLGGDVIVKGYVTGDVFSNRTVRVQNHAEVLGDVFAREIVVERGGRIGGLRQEIAFPDISLPSITISRSFPLLVTLFCAGFVFFIAAILIALASGPLERVTEKVRTGFVKSFLWGLLGWLLILPIFILLFITIVGIPVAILVYPIVVIVAFFLGTSAVAIFVGELCGPLLNKKTASPYLNALIGIIVIDIFAILAGILRLIGFETFSVMAVVLSSIVWILVSTVGLGAVMQTRFGLRKKAPAVPEPPAGPGQKAVPTPPTPTPPPPPADVPTSETPPPPTPPPPPKDVPTSETSSPESRFDSNS